MMTGIGAVAVLLAMLRWAALDCTLITPLCIILIYPFALYGWFRLTRQRQPSIIRSHIRDASQSGEPEGVQVKMGWK